MPRGEQAALNALGHGAAMRARAAIMSALLLASILPASCVSDSGLCADASANARCKKLDGGTRRNDDDSGSTPPGKHENGGDSGAGGTGGADVCLRQACVTA